MGSEMCIRDRPDTKPCNFPKAIKLPVSVSVPINIDKMMVILRKIV